VILALLSDLHANAEALAACLKHAQERGAGRYAFLGDLVGYGGDPAAVVSCVMRYAAEGAICVKGNHDDAVDGARAGYMNESVSAGIQWARQSLSAEQRAFLAGLPLCVREGSMCFVHASAATPSRWEYVDSPSAALKSAREAGVAYTFSGHVHEQMLYPQVAEDRMTEYKPSSGVPIAVAGHRKWLALVGSVGQPRDGHPAAAYVLFDDAARSLTFYRVPYDHLSAAGRIRAAGLPEALAFRVERGV
jgi:diadenosine tetraphosphatase ApaH/serine/threonine PP2A family protein phosphatase